MQKRMKNSRPRTPGGRYADGSSAAPAQSWNTGNFMPVRAPKPPKSPKPPATPAPESDSKAE